MRPTSMRLKQEKNNVSIHASVKDATDVCNWIAMFDAVSIHASVKDATAYAQDGVTAIVVSIHASVKDATNRYDKYAIPGTFQSTHP